MEVETKGRPRHPWLSSISTALTTPKGS